MKISGRNQFQGTITNIENGIVTSKVQLDIGGHSLTAVITKDSVDDLGLQQGENVTAVIKATEIMIMK